MYHHLETLAYTDKVMMFLNSNRNRLQWTKAWNLYYYNICTTRDHVRSQLLRYIPSHLGPSRVESKVVGSTVSVWARAFRGLWFYIIIKFSLSDNIPRKASTSIIITFRYRPNAIIHRSLDECGQGKTRFLKYNFLSLPQWPSLSSPFSSGSNPPRTPLDWRRSWQKAKKTKVRGFQV